MLMEVDSASVIKAQVEALRDDVRGKLREGKISISGGIAMQPRGVVVRIADPAERQRALGLLQSLNTPIGGAISGATGRLLDVSDTGDGAIRVALTDAAINDKVRRAVSAVDRGAEPPPQRLRHQGDQRSAAGRRPRVDRGAGPAGHDQAEGAARHDRQTRIPPRRRRRAIRPSDVETLPQQQGGTMPVEKRVMVAGEDLVDAQPGFDSRTRRARRQFPLQPPRRPTLRTGDFGQCRPAVRDRARRQGHFRAAHPRADHRRLGADHRQFHRRAGRQSGGACCAPARCRPSSP